MLSTNVRVYMWCQPKELHNPECLVPRVKVSGGSAMLWGAFSLHDLGSVIPLEGKANATPYLMVLSDHLHTMLQHFFPVRRGVFQDDNAPIHRACMASKGLMI